MSKKLTKTAAELREMIMNEARKHEECSNITSISFTRPLEANWNIQFHWRAQVTNPNCRSILAAFIDDLQRRYDMA